MVDLNALSAANAKRWANAKPTRKAEAFSVALRLYKSKQRYQGVERQTGVPWAVIAVIHERESSQQWNASLAQGDPWNRVSIHVPAGRGPFDSWEAAAIDALVECPPFLARHKDWSIAGALTALEAYNGIGYAARAVPSPYLWSGTDQYRAGKYVRDGVYDPDKVDPQVGCAALLMALAELDPGISFAGMKIARTSTTGDSAKPSLTNPSKGSIGAFVVNLIRAVFKRK
ncbi:lysozyme family protein [Bradyrhizobium sp. USDA 4448]